MNIKNLSWFGAFIIIVVLAIIAFTNIDDTNAKIEYSSLDVAKSNITTKDDISNPDVELLSNYIKSRKSNQPRELCDKIAYEIITQCKLQNISEDVVVGIIEIESMWDVYAKSKANAKGLMQILIEDGVEILPEKSYDIAYNIQKGIEIFKSKLNKSGGNIFLALQYYVGGDKDYHKQVYKYLGRYTLYKINNSQYTIANKVIQQYKG